MRSPRLFSLLLLMISTPIWAHGEHEAMGFWGTAWHLLTTSHLIATLAGLLLLAIGYGGYRLLRSPKPETIQPK